MTLIIYIEQDTHTQMDTQRKPRTWVSNTCYTLIKSFPFFLVSSGEKSRGIAGSRHSAPVPLLCDSLYLSSSMIWLHCQALGKMATAVPRSHIQIQPFPQGKQKDQPSVHLVLGREETFLRSTLVHSAPLNGPD